MHFRWAHLTQGPSAPGAHSEPTRAPVSSFARLHVSLGCACAGRTGKGNQGALMRGCSGEDSPVSVHRVLPLRTKRSTNQGDGLPMAPVHASKPCFSWIGPNLLKPSNVYPAYEPLAWSTGLKPLREVCLLAGKARGVTKQRN